jgi:iron complex transport system substrate-binding protein
VKSSYSTAFQSHIQGLKCKLVDEKVKYAVKSRYTSCGVTHTLSKVPERIVTMNQGATEFMLALGLADRMAGTAYLDDAIWPKYASAYAKIPVLASSYPDETKIMSVSPDFIVASYQSAFRQVYDGTKGIFSTATVGPCVGTGAEWAGAKTTCRPQLHAKGIGTFLFQY